MTTAMRVRPSQLATRCVMGAPVSTVAASFFSPSAKSAWVWYTLKDVPRAAKRSPYFGATATKEQFSLGDGSNAASLGKTET